MTAMVSPTAVQRAGAKPPDIPRCGENLRAEGGENGEVGILGHLDPDSAHQPRDRAIGLRFDPTGPMIEPKMRYAGQKQAAGGDPLSFRRAR